MKKITKTCKHCKQVVIEHHECKDGITYVRREMGPLLPFAYGPNDTIAKCEGGLTPCEWEVSE